MVYRLARLPLRIFNVDVWAGAGGARIGPGLCLINPANILIARGVEIGEDCLIHPQVTLGTGGVQGTPKVGNQVELHAGARILGGVRIGDRSIVGGNCVVIADVPTDSLVVAAESRVLPRTMSALDTRRRAAAGDAEVQDALQS